jgi:hypothetical protein
MDNIDNHNQLEVLTNNSETTDLKSKCLNSIISLYYLYENNNYMLQRLQNHIVNYLPNTLDNELKNHEKRVTMNNFLVSEKELFIKVFLNKNHFYYLSSSNYFYNYDGQNYYVIREDDIIHKLLSTISHDRVLMQWKYRTKIHILKQIKERSLFTSIPDTYTIQNVINFLYPSIFSSKNQVKYFLTVIGDNIFKKNNQHIFLVDTPTKKFLNEIDNIAYYCIGHSNTTSNFMTKYHENHSYENCRLIKLNSSFSLELWKNIIKNIGLNLLCVSTHYSNRYLNSDNFIENNADDEELKSYVFFIKNKSQIDILNQFCSSYIEEVECKDTNSNSTSKIGWKNIHFLWKQFLFNNNLPNIIYSNTLKILFKEKYSYIEKEDTFLHITSKYLPVVSEFILFWETTITVIDNLFEEDMVSNFENDFEMDELCRLFKLWLKQKSSSKFSSINEENILKIVSHFFSNVDIIEDKFISNIECNLWNKQKDIDESVEYIKNNFKNDFSSTLLSIDEAYHYYCKFANHSTYKFIVSKRYFEKYLYLKLEDYIVYENFISDTWFS